LRREPVNDDLHPAEVITDYLLPWVWLKDDTTHAFLSNCASL
jgi:hypothetical protein